MELKRGEAYFVEGGGVVGSEQSGDRPAIIVSNNACNRFSSVVEVVYLTSRTKTELPTHVRIDSLSYSSIALCEQVHSVSVTRLFKYICRLTDEEMADIDRALIVSLGLERLVSNEEANAMGVSGVVP